MSSVVTAGLAVAEGDGVKLNVELDAGLPTLIKADFSEENASAQDEQFEEGTILNSPPSEAGTAKDKTALPRPRTAADVTLSLTIDSSLDGDKLEKQLALLRRYGLI